MLANDFAGEAYVALNTVPGINGEGVSGFSMLRPIGLPLTQPRKMGGTDNIQLFLSKNCVHVCDKGMQFLCHF